MGRQLERRLSWRPLNKMGLNRMGRRERRDSWRDVERLGGYSGATKKRKGQKEARLSVPEATTAGLGAFTQRLPQVTARPVNQLESFIGYTTLLFKGVGISILKQTFLLDSIFQ